MRGWTSDDCIINGELNPETAAAVRALDSHAEISPSGGGVKVIVRGTKPEGAGCVKKAVLGCKRVEVYDKFRFFTVTENTLPGTPATVEDRQSELEGLCGQLWPKRGTVGKICTPSPKISQLGGGSVERCRRYLTMMDEAVSGDLGHTQTFTAACVCFRFGLSDTEAWEALVWFNANKCRPEWTDEELRHKWQDAKRRVEADGQFGNMDRPDRQPGNGKRPWHNDLPAWIRNLERPRLRPYQMAILQAIANRCDSKPIDAHGSLGNAIIGYQELADQTGMVRRTAFNHV